MKHFYLLFLCIGCSLALPAQEAAPDFARIRDYRQRMDSLWQYCNRLLGSTAGGDNYQEALRYGQQGLRMAAPKDHQSQARFAYVCGAAHYNLTRFDSALHYIRKSAAEADKTGTTWLLAISRSTLIPLYMQTQQLKAADSVAATLKAITDTSRDAVSLSKCYYGLGNYYYFQSYYATAQSYYLKSLEISRHISDTSADNRYKVDYAVQYYMLYKIYGNNELYEKALAALREGSRYMNSSQAVTLRYNSAYVEAYTTPPVDNIDSAHYYYRRLEAIPRKVVNSEYVMSNIAMAQYYIRTKAYPRALPFLDKAMQLAEESKAPFLLHQAQNIKGIYKFHTGAYDEAIDLLEKATAISKTVNKGNYLESVHLIAEAYRAKGNLRKAIEYYDIYNKEKDAFTRANMNRYFADLDIQYQTKEKEKQILSLRNDNKIRELELKNATRLRLFLIAGLVALGVISLLLYRIYRNKARLNQALNERNSELDRLNARLAVANESKARLFGIFSHDLRAPVSRIAQYLRLQKEQPGLFNEDSRSEYQEKFADAAANLLNTMEDLLLWSKSQMENFTPEYHAVSIGELAEKEIRLLHSQIEEKQLQVRNNIPGSFLSLTDENFVSIILRNLLQNAVRYSPREAVLTLDAEGSSVTITNPSVSGRSAETLNRLLQHDAVSSNHFGLGLQIARDLAERIGIRLSFAAASAHSIAARIEWQDKPHS